MDDSRDDLAARLLDAQVAFGIRQLTDDTEFAGLVEEEIENFFAEGGVLPMEKVMPRELVQEVARKYTLQFPVEGAIPELAGQVAARLYRSDIHERTVVDQVIEPRRFDELASTVVDLRLSQRAIEQVLESPATTDTLVELMQRAVEDRFGQRIGRRLSRLVERVTRSGTAMVIESTREDSGELLLDAVREFWHGRSGGTVGGFRESVSESDVEDVVVMAFEFWRDFRQSDYFQTLLAAGIDEVFDTYGATPIADVIEDLGIGGDDLREEALRFGPPVLARLDRDGVLEQILRRRLAPFFASPEFAACLQA
ncbi:hypothetical protein [Gordonia sp. (in: high G+C Gram-positive bacteria)]|uniref:hypothetical protein n=1 Tax=unclassified Gordonia (in: high G+C Gram-positive bacteria) TaxID=2657482 RepID=UPI002602CBC2|nr:hypothetical protein [Gordonia sp. (in: high G+C Gram-positive bacteria)]